MTPVSLLLSPARPRKAAPATNRALVRGYCAVLILALLRVPGAASVAPSGTDHIPQTLHYRVAWNGIPAASATVQVCPSGRGEHRQQQIVADAETNSFVDLFYPFRGHAETAFRSDDQAPQGFLYERRIWGSPTKTIIAFHDDERRALGTVEDEERKTHRQAVIGADILDPITAVFRARADLAKIGDAASYDVFTGERRYRIDLAVTEQDEIDVPAGAFPALRLEPAVWKIHGDERPPDPRLEGASIWVSNDPDNVLLKIRSEIFIGSVSLELVARTLGTADACPMT